MFGVSDGGGLAAADGLAAAAAGGCCGLLSEKNADVMADAVDMTSARGAGAEGR